MLSALCGRVSMYLRGMHTLVDKSVRKVFPGYIKKKNSLCGDGVLLRMNRKCYVFVASVELGVNKKTPTFCVTEVAQI